MIEFGKRTIRDQAALFEEVAARRGLSRVIVEKDYWVCFALMMLFEEPTLRDHLVFKGGTSLSKAFGVIKRFSEDIDLSLDPAWLGAEGEGDPDTADSKSARQRRWKLLEATCARIVGDRIMPLLERRISAVLGRSQRAVAHLAFRMEPQTRSPVITFLYPTATPAADQYVVPEIKLEFGSLTDQQPVGNHIVTPWVAEEFATLFVKPSTLVVALEAERTFWEKATILHSEYFRPADKPMRSRHSRDYYDLFALYKHPSGQEAIQDRHLMERVVLFKERYFRSSWSNFRAAVPGTFRVVPPKHRLVELRADYRQMQPMFFEKPPDFDEILVHLEEIESRVNSQP